PWKASHWEARLAILLPLPQVGLCLHTLFLDTLPLHMEPPLQVTLLPVPPLREPLLQATLCLMVPLLQATLLLMEPLLLATLLMVHHHPMVLPLLAIPPPPMAHLILATAHHPLPTVPLPLVIRPHHMKHVRVMARPMTPSHNMHPTRTTPHLVTLQHILHQELITPKRSRRRRKRIRAAAAAAAVAAVAAAAVTETHALGWNGSESQPELLRTETF
ncbi:hypothetical protein DUNSADRAFT_11552, partial [Dunaliella salina]